MDPVERALSGDVVVDIGHIRPDTRRRLNALVRRGTLSKWRGYWWPVSGASFGIGPLKTCYGLPERRAVINPA